ncbi:MAG TPA: triose-phosphate isomerase [Candidatus Moranbacteria bacterium]|nr:triose-phosphate isomerase [Candidatus Moranbacteria bacterium]HRZ33359.1 triose-phosphate isomerase [Candidatus Moranbacteria bacterium]
MKKIIVGNLKMNLLSSAERKKYFELFKKELKKRKITNAEFVLCPPYVHVESFVKELKAKNISIGSQNIFWEEKGPYTGEISVPMIKNMGGEYVILGHSDRRKYFFENDDKINLKIHAVLKNGLKVILCVGENAEEKKNGSGEAVIFEQLKNCLNNINTKKIADVIICYEPVWAISSNNPNRLPVIDEIMSAKILIKKFLIRKYKLKVAEKVKIIYGGSVFPENIKETCIEPGMDGVLVGKESLNPLNFIKMAETIDK